MTKIYLDNGSVVNTKIPMEVLNNNLADLYKNFDEITHNQKPIFLFFTEEKITINLDKIVYIEEENKDENINE